MKYNVTDLLDIQEFQKLMKEFYNITSISHALVDCDGNIINAVGSQEICSKFHRVNPDTYELCKQSDLSIKNKIALNNQYNIYQCKNGLVEAVTPIIIEGEHIGSIIFGQFFFTKPDINYFSKQASLFEFNTDEYLDSLAKVPIVSEEKVKSYMQYFSQLAKMLSSMGLSRLKQKETEKLLIKDKKHLEDIVTARTEKLEKINMQLEKDILQRKIIEKNLKKSEERYRQLIEVLPYGVCVRGKDSILFANKTAAKYFGLKSPEEMIGKNLSDFFYPHDDYKLEFEKNWEILLNTGYMPLAEQHLIRKSDGKAVNIETVSSVISYNEKDEILIVFRDISERKQLKKMKQKNEENKKRLKEKIEFDRLRTEFFANLSHELKTPVNLIFSALQLLELESKKKIIEQNKKNTRIKIMKQNCNRIIRLINNLIDITKIDSGYLQLDLQNHNIVSIVEDITLSVADYIENKNVKLIFDTDVEEKIMAFDPYAIERILLNLLSNAVKFTNLGDEIQVKINDHNENVIISVIDTGVGIPKDKLDLIFDRFRQVDKSFKRNHEGSGIGLSLVKSLINMHDGEIMVKSVYGEGSEFIIKLPVKQLDNIQSKIQLQDCDYTENYIEKINIEFSDIYS